MTDEIAQTRLPTIIQEVYVCVGVSATGDEQLIAVSTSRGAALPLFTVDKRSLPFLRTTAQQFADQTKGKVKLLRFENREVVEEFMEQLIKPAGTALITP